MRASQRPFVGSFFAPPGEKRTYKGYEIYGPAERYDGVQEAAA
jgi:hypothetical protein